MLVTSTAFIMRKVGMDRIREEIEKEVDENLEIITQIWAEVGEKGVRTSFSEQLLTKNLIAQSINTEVLLDIRDILRQIKGDQGFDRWGSKLRPE